MHAHRGPTPRNHTARSTSGRLGHPNRIGRVLSLVRKLIDYGRQLAATVEQRAGTPGFARFAAPFGTADIATILARITNGLRRAAALQAVLSQRVTRGQDLTPPSIGSPIARRQRPPRQATPPGNQPARQSAIHTEDPRLARLPTEDEIAAEVRRRPVGAVIVDICRDLGIMPGQLDRAFWEELSHAIIAYGGNLAGFIADLNKGLFSSRPDDDTDPAGPPAPSRLPASATGPP